MTPKTPRVVRTKLQEQYNEVYGFELLVPDDFYKVDGYGDDAEGTKVTVLPSEDYDTLREQLRIAAGLLERAKKSVRYVKHADGDLCPIGSRSGCESCLARGLSVKIDAFLATMEEIDNG